MDSSPVALPLAALSLAAQLFGVFVPRPVLAIVAVFVTFVAGLARLPALGAASLGLAVAAGLAALAWARPADRARGLHAIAAAFVLPALVGPAPVGSAPVSVLLAGGLATVLAAAAAGGSAAWARTFERRHALALLLALAPVAPRGGPWLRWAGGRAVIDDPQVGARWLGDGPLAATWSEVPHALGTFWLWAPALLVLAVVWAWVTASRREARGSHALPWIGLGLAILAIAVALGLGLAGVLDPAEPLRVRVPGALVPAPLWPPEPAADFTWLALLIARVLGISALIGRVPPGPVSEGPRLLAVRAAFHGAVFAAGLGLALVWVIAAAGWAGGAWSADPSAYALIAALVGTATAVPALWQRPDLARDLGHVAQLIGAAVLVGGAEAGLAVAGVVLAP